MICEIVWLSNELDILDLRLNELSEYIDKFIIVEYPFNYARQPAIMYYNENKERFKKFEDKIIHVIDDDPYDPKIFTDGGYHGIGLLWNRKNSILIKNALNEAGMTPEDFLIVSDGDAVLTKNFFKIVDITKVTSFSLKWYLYYFNLKIPDSGFNWTQASPYKWYNNGLVADNHNEELNHINHDQMGCLGYHFAKCGGIDKIIENIKGYPHQEYNVSEYTDRKKIQRRMDNKLGWTDNVNEKGDKLLLESYNPENYPEYINNNPQIFNKYFMGNMNV